MSQTSNNLAAYIWSLADLLRGDFKQSQYGRVILPFTLLRRLECVLESTKEAVLAKYEEVKKLNLPEDAQEKLLLDSNDAQQNQMMQLLSDPTRATRFAKIVFDLLKLGYN